MCLWFYRRWNLKLISSSMYDFCLFIRLVEKIKLSSVLEKVIVCLRFKLYLFYYFWKAFKTHMHFLHFHCCNLSTALAEYAVKGKFQKNMTYYVRKEEERPILKGSRIILRIKVWNKLLILVSHYLNYNTIITFLISKETPALIP